MNQLIYQLQGVFKSVKEIHKIVFPFAYIDDNIL